MNNNWTQLDSHRSSLACLNRSVLAFATIVSARTQLSTCCFSLETFFFHKEHRYNPLLALRCYFLVLILCTTFSSKIKKLKESFKWSHSWISNQLKHFSEISYPIYSLTQLLTYYKYLALIWRILKTFTIHPLKPNFIQYCLSTFLEMFYNYTLHLSPIIVHLTVRK